MPFNDEKKSLQNNVRFNDFNGPRLLFKKKVLENTYKCTCFEIMAEMAETSNFKLIFFVKYAYSKSFAHLGNTTALIFNKKIKMLIPHHGLKELQKWC